MGSVDLFPDGRRGGYVPSPRGAGGLIEHEVFFEANANALGERAFFLGQAYGPRRYAAAGLCILFFFAPLAVRAIWMQGFRGETYAYQAEANRLRNTPVLPRRGIIRDRQGTVLVENVPRFQATLTPRDLPRDTEGMNLALGEASRLLGRSLREISSLAGATGTRRDDTVSLADRMPYTQAIGLAVALPRLPGFDLEVVATRHYPLSREIPSLSHVLGYVGKLSPDEYAEKKKEGYRLSHDTGKSGVEKSYERALRGTLGSRIAEVDAHGAIQATVGDTAPVDGKDLTLALDVKLQATGERLLRDAFERSGARRGSVIAMDPRTGGILAAVSLPTYQHNDFSTGVSSTAYQVLLANPDQPLFPRAWAGVYPSGSTVKIVYATAALAEHLITPQTLVVSVGGIRIGQWFFPDWKAGGHGVVHVRQAIAWSVNTFFYTIGGGYQSFVGMGPDVMGRWLRRFGLGAPTGIDVPAEGAGFVPSPTWKEQTKKERWYVGDTYNLSIGQGDLLVTPLQVAVYTAAIANGGWLVTPHVVESMDVGEDAQKVSIGSKKILDDKTAIDTVRQGMREAVMYGSARLLSSLPFAAAGKTGTAQWHAEKKTHAWFTSFAPFEAPEIVVTVLVEEGGEGSSFAAPVANGLMREWWNLRQSRGGVF